MTTVGGNKIIAEFMGLTIYPNDVFIKPASMSHILEKEIPNYHYDWNALMPVVEKIEADERFATMMYVNTWDNRGRYIFSIYRETDEYGDMRHRFVEAFAKTKIEAIWLGILDYIKISNDGKLPTSRELFGTFNEYYNQIKEAHYK